MKPVLTFLAAVLFVTAAQAGMQGNCMSMMDMPMMKDHMAKMHEHMGKLKAAKSDKERQQLMVEHMGMMDEHMEMMMKMMGDKTPMRADTGASDDAAAPASDADHEAHHPK